MTDNYSNREIDRMITDTAIMLTARLDVQDKTLARIETQTTMTNGTVRWHTKILYLFMGAVGFASWLYANDFLQCVLNTTCVK